MNISQIKNAKKLIICPRCGWVGGVRDLGDWGQCPSCHYENTDRPYRLCTLKELTVYDGDRYCDVDMAAFLGSLFRLINNIVPDPHEIWAAAQLMPGEGIEDGVRRISEIVGA